MNTRTTSLDSPSIRSDRLKSGWFEGVVRRQVLARLKDLELGQVVLREGGETMVFGTKTDEFPSASNVKVHHPGFYTDIAFGGSVGAGEAYINGFWSCDDLGELLRKLIRNRDVLQRMDTGLAILSKPLKRFLHFLNRNSRTGSRKNIAAHYDLGNDFYQLWLDASMMYSCAYFESAETSLDEAAAAKLDRICKKLALSPTDSVVEIGTGWGGFAIHAARNYGCHVTTTTISEQQFNYARQEIKDAGLEDRITLLFQDYRDLEGSFDKLVSIEMIEAVGHEYHASYFQKCCDLLKKDGQMVLQAITIADQRYDTYKNGVDFIKRYIFPGGCLTSVTDMTRVLTRHTDMRVLHLEDIGPHYATTLRQWHDRFFAQIDAVRELGYSDEFIRMWQYYLCYCESAFTERVIGNVQMLLMRPDARSDLR